MGKGDVNSVHPNCPIKIGLRIFKIGKQGHSGLGENSMRGDKAGSIVNKNKNQCQYLDRQNCFFKERLGKWHTSGVENME